jgi:carboxyl-terminal processing protease
MKTITSVAAWMLSVATALGADHIVGVGMELSKGSENGPPKIKGVVPAAPAAKAGIQAGWILLSINGTNTAGRSMNECVSLVRGEEGTRVRLELADPAHGRTNKVTLTREKILTPGSRAKGGTP